MKKVLKCFLAIMCVIALSGCQSGGNKTSSNSIEGILKSFSGNLLTINTIQGDELIFDVSQATVETTHGLLSGDDILLQYEGSIKDKDTSKAVVKRVIDKTKDDPNVQETVISGEVVDSSMNTITIKVNGKEIAFNTAMAEMDIRDGIKLGNMIYITYIGQIQDTDATGVQVLKIVDNEENAKAEEPKASATPKPTLVPVENIKVTEKTDWLYGVLDTNIYAGNSKEYKKVGFLWQHQGIDVTGVTDNGWTRVFLDGTTGFVPSDMLTSTVPATPTPKPTEAPKVTPTPTPVPKHTLNIEYVDTDEKPLFKNYVDSIKEGQTYDITSPTTNDYVVSINEVKGVMGQSDVEVTVVYTHKDAPTPEPTVEATPVPTAEPTVEPTPVTTPTPEPVVYKTITGYVVSTDASSITIDVDGVDLQFNTENASTNYSNGLLVGNKVDIEYAGDISGEDTTNTMVSSITDNAENDNNPHLKGAVIGTTQNTFTICTPDGAELTFYYGDYTTIETESGTIDQGARIKVCPDGSKGATGNIFYSKAVKTDTDMNGKVMY